MKTKTIARIYRKVTHNSQTDKQTNGRTAPNTCRQRSEQHPECISSLSNQQMTTETPKAIEFMCVLLILSPEAAAESCLIVAGLSDFFMLYCLYFLCCGSAALATCIT
ncbi:unnamed protein product [Ceratitis capitata]|uniref:(Mediterranean fruit fly) hypothetical protein n=1 Tax=Ceratitis capitata TaxID=7213 RepID=A0A811UZB3_CERCA|nr:unnamed protein product [Ceratitis capitata]